LSRLTHQVQAGSSIPLPGSTRAHAPPDTEVRAPLLPVRHAPSSACMRGLTWTQTYSDEDAGRAMGFHLGFRGDRIGTYDVVLLVVFLGVIAALVAWGLGWL